MNRILSWLGCSGVTLLAILYALGVTETIKYVGPLKRTLVLTAAVLAAAAPSPLHKTQLKDEPTQQERPTPFKDQLFKVDRDVSLPRQMSEAPAPAPDPPIHNAILSARTQAILFRQIVPPNHDPAHLSFFGGPPIAPPGFQWPRGEYKPYSFIMQVDCSAVPAAGRLGIFPDHGVLYVFLDLEWSQEKTFRVIWEPGPTQGCAEITRPLPDDDALDEIDETDYTYAWPGTINPEQALPAIEVVQSRSFRYRRDRPFAGFPHDWNAVRITTGLIAESIKHELLFSEARKRNFAELSDAEYTTKVSEAQAALRDWLDRASAAAAFDEVPAAERDQFWLWVQELHWLSRSPMLDAGEQSVEASLSASREAAARIPPDVVDYIRGRHALARELEGKIYINIPDRMLAPPTSVQDNLDRWVREFLLLLELSSNEGLAHYFGESVYQFWIRPDDLAARRFDRVELGITGY